MELGFPGWDCDMVQYELHAPDVMAGEGVSALAAEQVQPQIMNYCSIPGTFQNLEHDQK